jgi:hypothetical protein
MRTIVIMSLVVIVIGASLGASVGGAVPKEPIMWGAAKEGCRLALKTSSRQYRFDEPISVAMTLKNDSNNNVKYEVAKILMSYKFDVRLPDGGAAPLTLEGKKQRSGYVGIISRHLRPSELITEDIPMLNRLYDMTLLGEYTVTAYRRLVLPTGGDGKEIEVQSNSIKITVTEETASTMPASSGRPFFSPRG